MMMKTLILIILFLINAVHAAGPRKVDMSWPPVQGAEAYEFKLIKTSSGSDKTVSVDKLNSPHWEKEVNPGEYNFQIRSLDYRNVPGPWSKAQSFTVSLPTVKQITPILNQSFYLKSNQEASVNFSWEDIKDAQRYHFILKNEANKIIQEDTIADSTINFEIEKPGKYWWKVTALTAKDKNPKKIKFERYFRVLSPPLEAPKAHFKVTKDHILIDWEQDEKAVKDKIIIFRRVNNKWKKIIQRTLKNNNTVSFKKNKIRKGKYKLRIVAYTKENQPSDPAIVYFNWDSDSISNIKEEKKKIVIPEDEWSKSPFFIGGGFSLLSLDYDSELKSVPALIADKLTGNAFLFNY